jgi:hypothetical protein
METQGNVGASQVGLLGTGVRAHQDIALTAEDDAQSRLASQHLSQLQLDSQCPFLFHQPQVGILMPGILTAVSGIEEDDFAGIPALSIPCGRKEKGRQEREQDKVGAVG